MRTTVYMSPEQIRGEKIDFRSDLYAPGCILHEPEGHQPEAALATRKQERPLIATLDAMPAPQPAVVKETRSQVRMPTKQVERRPAPAASKPEPTPAPMKKKKKKDVPIW